MSWLPPGEAIPDDERWDGVPAQPAGVSPEPQAPSKGKCSLSPTTHRLLLIASRLALAVAASLPFVALVIVLITAFGINAEKVIEWLFNFLFEFAVLGPLLLLVTVTLPFTLILQALLMHCLGEIRLGTVSRWSLDYLRVWLKPVILQAVGQWLSGTIWWPQWLRLAGMKIGKKSEISTIIDVIPERVEIRLESFFADGIYLGGPHVHRGTVTVASTRLKRNTFLGNHAVIPAGQQLPDNQLIGLCTVADDAVVKPSTSWFGHPPFELLYREVIEEVERRLTHDPDLLRYLTRLLWEGARFLLSVPPLLALLGWFKALAAVDGTSSWVFLGWFCPASL